MPRDLKWTPPLPLAWELFLPHLPWVAQVLHIVGGGTPRRGLVRIAFLILICILDVLPIPAMYGKFYVHLVDFCGRRRYIYTIHGCYVLCLNLYLTSLQLMLINPPLANKQQVFFIYTS